jgi:hypothetical protein
MCPITSILTSAEDLKFANLFKEPNINHSDEINDSIKVEIIGIKEALQSLKTMHMFLL